MAETNELEWRPVDSAEVFPDGRMIALPVDFGPSSRSLRCAVRLSGGADGGERHAKAVETPVMWLFEPIETSSRGLVLVVAGGSYEFISVDNEGYRPAEWLNARGYTAAVLLYRLPAEQRQWGADRTVSDAVHALEWLAAARTARDPNGPQELGLIGFSAGAHLALAAGSIFSRRTPAAMSWMALFYPVFRLESSVAHRESAERWLRGSAAHDRKRWDGPALVHEDLPPIFARHLIQDPVVPADNLWHLCDALDMARRESKSLDDIAVLEGDLHGVGLTPAFGAEFDRFLVGCGGQGGPR